MIQFPSAVDRPCQRPLLVVNGLVSDCYVTGEVAQFRFVRINQYIINPNDLTSDFLHGFKHPDEIFFGDCKDPQSITK